MEEQDSLNTEEEQDSLNPEEEQDDSLNSSEEDVSSKLKELAQNYRIRAEKAEKQAKTLKEKLEKESPRESKGELSQSDLIGLIRADVHEDDIQDVVDYAKLKKISVSEALKANVVKSLLTEKKEERTTAEATATGNKRSGVRIPTGKEILYQAEQGNMPESEEEIGKLIDARYSR